MVEGEWWVQEIVPAYKEKLSETWRLATVAGQHGPTVLLLTYLKARSTGDGGPEQLQLQLATLHISEPEDDVLHNPAIFPGNGTLISKAVLPVGLHGGDDGAIGEVGQVHLHCLHKRLDIDLGVAHLVVGGERVLVVNLLQKVRGNQSETPHKSSQVSLSQFDFVSCNGRPENSSSHRYLLHYGSPKQFVERT